MKRTTKLVLAVPLVLSAGWPFLGGAGADSPSIAGWWTSANPGLPALPVSSPIPGGGPGGLPSDVPAGGLEVSSAAGQSSYAAVGYYDVSGAQVGAIVLTIDSKAVNTPNSAVKACRLTGAGTFSPAEGDPASQGPAYDCSTSVAGKADPASGTVSFAVGDWVRNGYLGVAIVADGPGRTVFDAPGDSAITLAGDTGTAAVGASPQAGAVAPVAAPGTPPGYTAAPAGAPSLPSAASPPSAAPVAAGTDHSPQLAAPTPPAARTATATSLPATLAATEHPYTVGIGGALVGALLIVAGAAWVAVRGRRPVLAEQDSGTS